MGAWVGAIGVSPASTMKVVSADNNAKTTTNTPIVRTIHGAGVVARSDGRIEMLIRERQILRNVHRPTLAPHEKQSATGFRIRGTAIVAGGRRCGAISRRA